MKLSAVFLAVLTLTACSDQQPVATPSDTRPAAAPATEQVDAGRTAPVMPAPMAPEPPPAPEEMAQSDFLGRWTGVEGMYLLVTEKPSGGVTMEIQWDLDNKGTFDGSVTAEGLRFMRNGVAETAARTNGDATGLKYLAGKQECLTVKPGEGYCRD